jgi:putative membrane protein
VVVLPSAMIINQVLLLPFAVKVGRGNSVPANLRLILKTSSSLWKQTFPNPPTNSPQDRTHLALERTLMAASRSLMAWVRTGLSMIGFGFTIYKFLSSDAQGLVRDPRNVGLSLISLGILSILFGAIEYRQTVGDLRRNFGGRFRKYPLIMAALIGGLGLALLVTALLDRS